MITLKPGNVVETAELSTEQYHQVAKAFLKAGASKGEYGTYNEEFKKWAYFGWCSCDGLYHADDWSCSDYASDNTKDNQVLRFDQVVNQTWRGMQDGLPPVGTKCWYGVGEVVIVAHDRKEGEDQEHAVFRSVHNTQYEWAYRGFSRLKTEQEAIAELIDCSMSPAHNAEVLYSKGYRLVENT